MSCLRLKHPWLRGAASLGILSAVLGSRNVLTAQSARPAGKYFDRVIIVVLENEGTRDALQNSVFAQLSAQAAWFSNYYSIMHPSFPNYLALVGGSTFNRTDDHRPPPLNGATIADRLEAKGLTWRAYAEDYPGRCFLGSGAGAGKLTPKAAPTELFARKHVPFLSFASIQQSPQRCARVVNAISFMDDVRSGKLPNYSFYTPNMFNNGHDTSIDYSSRWLSGFLAKLRAAKGMERTVIVVTWDEGAGKDFKSNKVLTLLLGGVVNPGQYKNEVSHYSLLRTIEDNFGLEPLASGDREADPLPDAIWRNH